MSEEVHQHDERSVRLEKRAKIINSGIDLYPSKSHRTKTCTQALMNFDDSVMKHERIVLAGRIRSIRRHGGSIFLSVEDGSGRIQWYLKCNECNEEDFVRVKEFADIGDFIEGAGELFLTKTGEKTLRVISCRFLAKSLVPLPEQWHGLSDIEIRYRKRYLDLLANPAIKSLFMTRSVVIRSLRSFFEKHDFVEVDTPILQPIASGAAARPFATHHHALDIPLYLRVAPELYLKRLVIGGFDRVFEVARCFRNEGIDHSHNPEFTQIEAYMAYCDYGELMSFVEEMLISVLNSIHTTLSFSTPFERITFRDALIAHANLDINQHTSLDDLKNEAHNRGIDSVRYPTRGALFDEFFKTFIRAKIVKPTFVIDYPIELSPLAKKKSNTPLFVERFQLVVKGTELVNGFTEINDAVDQYERFEDQKKAKILGDVEAQASDDDFVKALEYGMPPTAGFGIGIDRLCALLTDSASLKEVILFPTLRPKKDEYD